LLGEVAPEHKVNHVKLIPKTIAHISLLKYYDLIIS